MGDMLPGWSFQVLTYFPCIEYCFGKFSLAGEHFVELLIVMSQYNTCVFSVWYFSVTRETKTKASFGLRIVYSIEKGLATTGINYHWE
jgi:hypothetical protein